MRNVLANGWVTISARGRRRERERKCLRIPVYRRRTGAVWDGTAVAPSACGLRSWVGSRIIRPCSTSVGWGKGCGKPATLEWVRYPPGSQRYAFHADAEHDGSASISQASRTMRLPTATASMPGGTVPASVNRRFKINGLTKVKESHGNGSLRLF
jgi:hypothetical protein